MDYRTLGRTGLEVSVVGLGGAGLGTPPEILTDEHAVEIVRRALDLGITFIDTAPLYGSGLSEQRIGLALHGYAGGSDCIVATKIGYYPADFDFSYDATVRSVEASLTRLG